MTRPRQTPPPNSVPSIERHPHMTLDFIRPVILCGGSGTRLWPVSRADMPKQFSRIAGGRTLLQDTVRRLEDAGCADPLFLTHADYRFLVAGQAEEIGLTGHRIVLEPEGRNTAASICAAAEILHRTDPEALMLVAPSDHALAEVMPFAAAVARGAAIAREGHIVTFGIAPDRPETGYGYIQAAPDTDPSRPRPYLRFVEKPDAGTAARMLDEGGYLWNAGIFLMTVATARAAFGQHAPALRAAVRRSVREAQEDLDFLRLGPTFAAAAALPFDKAVMERGPGWVVPMDCGWSDLGTWRSVWQHSGRDADGLALSGPARGLDCADTLLMSADPGVEVVGIGLRNIAAIATGDAVLIADLDSGQSVAAAAAQLRAEGVRQGTGFPRCERPWGHYETLSLGNRFQVKSIVVKPGGKLSLQSHVHRAEHWVVVAGTATVTIGSNERLLGENQSVYIPLGEVHRLANDGKVPLQLIEVQTGSYLGEDDIIRYEDVYARA